MTAGPRDLPPWSELLATALVGTRRRPVEPPEGSGLPRGGDHASTLLDLAAAVASLRRAAVAPAAVRPGAPPELPVGGPPLPPAAAARAAELLAVDGVARPDGPLRDVTARVELLAEWLDAAVARGRLLPGELVPALLDTGRRHHGLRHRIDAAAGPLAAWLAGQRQDWAYHLDRVPADRPRTGGAPAGRAPGDTPPAEVWEVGSSGQRAGYLRGLRATDPRGALDLLAADWDAETPEDRAALLPELATGLSPADEAFLERALDDRRAQVRAVAADLLAALPGSGYAQRMVQRATACVTVSPGGRLRVTPPGGCDRAMRRDGIVARPPAGVGQRAWWLEEVLARTPLSVWPGQPEAFLAGAAGDPWRLVLLRGLARAAAVSRDADWADTLATMLTAQVRSGHRPDDRLLLDALHEVLPAGRLADRAAAMLAGGLASGAEIGVEHLLELCPRPWPPGLTGAFLAALGAAAPGHTAGWRVAGLCETAALRLPPSVAGPVTDLADELRAARPADPATAVVHRLAATLRYRRQMIEELS